MVAPTYLAFLPLWAYHTLPEFTEVFSWKNLSYEWPSDYIEERAIEAGDYVPENNLPLGMELWKNKLFLTIPRWKSGVPTSLGYIPLDKVGNNKSPSIIPYPSWEANAVPELDAIPNDGHISSTFRVAVDVCDRLWVMDSGLVDILGEIRTISPPAIVIYDLNTDELIRRYTLDPKVLKEGPFFVGSFFPNIVIDANRNRCGDAYAYLPDVSTNAIVVYSFKENKSWKFTHHFFHFDPLQGNFNADGVNFQWNDGVFGLALGPEDVNGFRKVYFHPSASLNEFSVNSAVLKNENLVDDPHNYYLFKLEGCKGPNTQTTGSVYDIKSNVIFLTQLNRNGVACWNPRRPLQPENVAMIAEDREKLGFSNEIRIDEDRYLWILSNKMPKFIYDHLNNKEINYRIYRVKVDDVIAGTPCVA